MRGFLRGNINVANVVVMCLICLPVVSIAQFSNPKLVVCRNEEVVYTLNYFVPGESPSCTLFWSVTDGVFPDKDGRVSFSENVTESGTKTVKVKWTGNFAGSLDVSGCNLSEQKNIAIDAISLSVSADPLTISLGDMVTLTATSNASQFLWSSSPSQSSLSSTSGATVTALPRSTTTFACTATATFAHGSGNNTCSQLATKTVNVLVPPIQGNDVCCAQCVGAGVLPEQLKQLSGVMLSGGNGNPLNFQWQRSTNGTDYSNISGANSSIYSPGSITQSTWYRRVVSGTGVAANASQPILIEAILNSPIVLASGYSLPKTLKATGTITIQGNQTLAANVQVNFRSDNTIRVLPSTVLVPNMMLTIGLNCGVPNGRLADVQSELDTRNYDSIGAPELDDVVIAYPNPAKDFVIFRYVVRKACKVSLDLMDRSGSHNIASSERVDPGVYEMPFSTKLLKPGVYFYRLRMDYNTITKRFVVIN